MATEPITGGTGLPEERSKLPLIQTEQQAGIADTPATLPTGTQVEAKELEVGTDELLTAPAPLSTKSAVSETSPTTNLDVTVIQRMLTQHLLKQMPQQEH